MDEDSSEMVLQVQLFRAQEQRKHADIVCRIEEQRRKENKHSAESKRLSLSQSRQLFHLVLADGLVIFAMTSLSCLLFSYSQRLLNVLQENLGGNTVRGISGKDWTMQDKMALPKANTTFCYCVLLQLTAANMTTVYCRSYQPIVLASLQHAIMPLVSVSDSLHNTNFTQKARVGKIHQF